MFRISGDALVDGAIGPNATRTTTEAIASFLEQFNSHATAGMIEFSQASYSVDENGVNATIAVTRSGGSDGEVTVNYTTLDGNATAGDDYISQEGVLTFADGETFQTFEISIADDAVEELAETINLVLSNPVNGATLGSNDRAILTIINNDRSESNGFNIELDYRFDSTGFFDDLDRRAALAAVAEIWESFIQDDFTNVPAGISFAVENPTTGETEMVVLDAEIDDLLIFVGARLLPGNTRAQAGPDGVNAVGSIFSNRLQGSNFEPWVGSMTFAQEANWFFDLTPETDDDIPFGQSDFITTALHEIGHILGIGIADIFQEIGAGAAFDGFNAIAVNGGDPIPLESNLVHVQDGFLNNTVLMDPRIAAGTRKLPTQVDLALLADIGYEISGFTAQGETPAIATPEDDVTIFGTIIADTIDGLGGSDQIQGDRGDDLLDGGDGDDLIFGEEGNDTLNGGVDDDILIGGEGIDTFFFAANNGADRIEDFDIAEDAIALVATLGFATGQDVIEAITTRGNVTGGGRFAVVTLSPENQIIILADNDITAANFIIV